MKLDGLSSTRGGGLRPTAQMHSRDDGHARHCNEDPAQEPAMHEEPPFE
jgi:hypothetical protein